VPDDFTHQRESSGNQWVKLDYPVTVTSLVAINAPTFILLCLYIPDNFADQRVNDGLNIQLFFRDRFRGVHLPRPDQRGCKGGVFHDEAKKY
jgi:hypothetical protein